MGAAVREVWGGGRRDQWAVELYHRLPLLPHLTVTPDVQLLFDPALDAAAGVVAVFGLRVRVDL